VIGVSDVELSVNEKASVPLLRALVRVGFGAQSQNRRGSETGNQKSVAGLKVLVGNVAGTGGGLITGFERPG
jgi:hypothetical protein